MGTIGYPLCWFYTQIHTLTHTHTRLFLLHFSHTIFARTVATTAAQTVHYLSQWMSAGQQHITYIECFSRLGTFFHIFIVALPNHLLAPHTQHTRHITLTEVSQREREYDLELVSFPTCCYLKCIYVLCRAHALFKTVAVELQQLCWATLYWCLFYWIFFGIYLNNFEINIAVKFFSFTRKKIES